MKRATNVEQESCRRPPATIVAAALLAMSAILAALLLPPLLDPDAYLGLPTASAVVGVVIFVSVVAAMSGGLVILALFVWRGRSWATLVVTILSALAFIGFALGDTAPIALAATVCLAGAAVLLWLPRSRHYSRSMSARAPIA